MSPHPISKNPRGLTLVELLVVIAILGVLVGILVPSLGKVKQVADAAKTASNLKQIAVSTIAWSTDNSGKLPSPQYPGGMEPPRGVDPEDFFPQYYDMAESGLWLDGVVFATLYIEEQDLRAQETGDLEEGETTTGGYEISSDGEHLKGTMFEVLQSVRADPEETNWHRHSFAMNANLQYDGIYEELKTGDKFLTEKTLTKLLFAPNAMLFTECSDTNVIMQEDMVQVEETAEERWGKDGKISTAFLDGHVERMRARDFPRESVTNDRIASRFWRGVDID